MRLQNGSIFVGKVTTIGRHTGLSHTVELRLVYLDSRFYASSARVQNKHWCRNLIKNPTVEVKTGDKRFSCLAREVTEEQLRSRILSLRDSPPLLDRVVFEMTPQKPPHSTTINPG